MNGILPTQLSPVWFCQEDTLVYSRRTYPHNKVTTGCGASEISYGEGGSIILSETGSATGTLYVVGHLLWLRSGSLVAQVDEMVAVDYQHFQLFVPCSRYYVSIWEFVGLRLSTFLVRNVPWIQLRDVFWRIHFHRKVVFTRYSSGRTGIHRKWGRTHRTQQREHIGPYRPDRGTGLQWESVEC